MKTNAKIKMIYENSLEIDDGVEDFIRFSKSKNLSPATIDNYQKQARAFNQFYDKSINGITSDVVIDYVDHMRRRFIKPVSINTALRHMKAIFRFWADKELMKPVKISFLKYQEEVKECYTDEELTALLKKPNTKECTFQEFRTWAVINFFIDSGCRVQTLTNILISDVDFNNGLIQFRHTKNKLAQFIPLSSTLANILGDYLRTRKGKPNDLLFPSESNTQLLGTTVTHNIKHYCEKRQVRIGNSHLFRHTFTKNWLLRGGDPLRLQKILGHQSLQMVQHYANLYKADLKLGYEEYSMLNKLTTQKVTMR